MSAVYVSEVSLPNLQVPAAGTYYEWQGSFILILSFPLYLYLTSCLFPSGFPTRILYTCITFPICVSFPVYFTYIYLITLIILEQSHFEAQLTSSPHLQCNDQYSKLPVSSHCQYTSYHSQLTVLLHLAVKNHFHIFCVL